MTNKIWMTRRVRKSWDYSIVLIFCLEPETEFWGILCDWSGKGCGVLSTVSLDKVGVYNHILWTRVLTRLRRLCRRMYTSPFWQEFRPRQVRGDPGRPTRHLLNTNTSTSDEPEQRVGPFRWYPKFATLDHPLEWWEVVPYFQQW